MIYFDEETEASILCDFIRDKSVIERLISKIAVTDFYKPFHQELFLEIVRLYKKGVDPDEKTLIVEFKKQNQDRTVEIMQIASTTGSTANVDYYFGILKSLYAKRSIEILIDDAKTRLQDVSQNGVTIAGEVEKSISRVTLGLSGDSYRKAASYMGEICDQLQWNINTNGQIKGVDNPFNSINEITGFRNGEYIVIAARPSMGKTAFALNIIESVAVRKKIPTGLFSVEMSAKQLNLRLISSMTKYSLWGIDKGIYKAQRDSDRIAVAMTEIAHSPLFIDETSNIRISELKAKARRMVRVDGCKILFVDYIGLIDDEQPRIPRHEQIADISRTFKSLAKELDVPVVVLSQLTRDSEGNKPTLASLAETRSIEKDADVVMFIHRDRDDPGKSEKAKESLEAK